MSCAIIQLLFPVALLIFAGCALAITLAFAVERKKIPLTARFAVDSR